MFQTVKSIPASNLPAKVMTGVFAAGMLNMPSDAIIKFQDTC